MIVIAPSQLRSAARRADGSTGSVAGRAVCAGPSLTEAVERYGPLPAGSVLTLAAGLAQGLDEIHKAGAVHPDPLRPEFTGRVNRYAGITTSADPGP